MPMAVEAAISPIVPFGSLGLPATPVTQLPIFQFADDLTSAIEAIPISPSQNCDRECRQERLIKRLWEEFLAKKVAPGIEIPPPGSNQPAVPGAPALLWPFAGTVLAIFPCPCNAGIAVVTLPVYGSAGPYFIPLAGLRSYYSPLPGNLIMGAAVPGGFCGSPLLCLPLPVAYTVPPILPGAGTSLVPPLVPPLPMPAS